MPELSEGDKVICPACDRRTTLKVAEFETGHHSVKNSAGELEPIMRWAAACEYCERPADEMCGEFECPACGVRFDDPEGNAVLCAGETCRLQKKPQ